MASNKKTIYEQLYAFQTRLQGVANDLGIKLAAVVSSSDQDVLKHLLKELPKEQGKSVQGELRRLQKIVKGVEDIRKKSFDLAKDTLISTSLDVAKAGTDETAKEFNAALGEAARKEREKRFCKTLNEDQLKAIIDGQGIDGATIGEWFSGWQRDDLERISRAVQKATVEQLTVSDIAKQIRGTKENDYNDGILATTRVGAVRLARTLINGVCNNARAETIKANSDVIDGIKFVGTLDGKTCPHCASYDGHIWRGEDMASARRPPIHPNCRCTLVPYVELKDEEGNVVDIDNERPAANADFDQLAKDAYNQKAKEKGWKRRFEDLSPSTRLKYYYQAQKDYERETGKPAYRQVDSNLSFPEYFKQQPDSFKRAWLGAKRYEAYKDGKLTEKAIFAPDLGYTISPSSLVKFVEPEVPEELDKLIKEYEKKGAPTLTPSSASESTIDYAKFIPNYDGITDVNVLRLRWKDVSNEERSEIQKEIQRQRNAWNRKLAEAKPVREDFSSQESYDQAYDVWHDFFSDSMIFWESVDEALPELELAPEKEFDREVPKSANDALDKIQHLREKKLDKQAADKENSIAESRAVVASQIAPINAELYRKNKEFNNPNTTKERKKTLDREKLILLIDKDSLENRMRRLGRTLDNDKTGRRELLKYLFPDKGGTSFFEEETKKMILDSFEKIGKRSIAEEALAFYALIAKCCNTKKVKIDQIREIIFKDLPKDERGSYNNIELKINISNILKDNNDSQLLLTIIHELGHWLEERGFGYDRAAKNVEWLIKETGKKVSVSGTQYGTIDDLIPVMPNLCSRLDGYSKKIYVNKSVPGNSNKKYRSSELISTGMEDLYDDVETFARKSPRHFDLMLQNFEGLME